MAKEYSGNRDPRFVRVQRGGTLQDATHSELALWAAACAERVLPLFEDALPSDGRPREAIDAARAWASGGISMTDARGFAYAAHDAARAAAGAGREAARAAGHAVATAHMADHELGAAFYALRAVSQAFSGDDARLAEERDWQRRALPPGIRDLVLDDMRRRAGKFRGMFGVQ